MKKYISTVLMMAMVAVMIPFMSTTASAQTQCYTDSRGRTVCTETNRRSFYKRHRNKINVGIGAVAGAVLGGLIGGKKGALIGTAAGAGGAALYTYKLNPKTRRYERVYNRNARLYRRY